MPQAALRHVFVYGTLRKGGRNDINRLLPKPQWVGVASVPGTLYLVDWYPGLILGDPETGRVSGEVYCIAPQLEAVLDGIEEVTAGPDSEYVKREVAVAVAGTELACLVYEVNPARVRGKTVIDGGDWMLFHPE